VPRESNAELRAQVEALRAQLADEERRIAELRAALRERPPA
jgi:hypothetical protein